MSVSLTARALRAAGTHRRDGCSRSGGSSAPGGAPPPSSRASAEKPRPFEGRPTERARSIAQYLFLFLMFTLLDLCVSSLRRGHANLLCIVPILTDDPRRESEKSCSQLRCVPAMCKNGRRALHGPAPRCQRDQLARTVAALRARRDGSASLRRGACDAAFSPRERRQVTWKRQAP